MFAYELIVGWLETSLETDSRHNIALAVATATGLMIAVVTTFGGRDAACATGGDDGELLAEYFPKRRWRTELGALFNAIHECRCLLSAFSDVPVVRRLLHHCSYCGTPEDGGVFCARHEGRWWWLGYCSFHKCRRWEDHLDSYKRLRDHSAKTSTTRIDFLTAALNVVDAKSSSLMQFNALLVPATIFLLQRGAFDFAAAPPRVMWWGVVCLPSWLWTVYLCVRNQSDIVWGDPRRELAKAEQLWTREVLGHVVMRTARVRMAMLATLLTVALASAMFTLAWRAHGSGANEHGHVAPSAYAAFYVKFKPGLSCGAKAEVLQLYENEQPKSIEELITRLKSTYATVLVVGSADIQALSRDGRSRYGNNAGLALDRAECVARRLQAALVEQGVFVRMEVGVRRPGMFSKAVEADRTADILVLP
jgi:hypothetical protein